MFTQHVFRTMDRKKMGKITFKEFLVWLSEISHGTIGDKIAWTFRLYDTNEDEMIDREDLLSIIKSIYLLMGKKRDADDDLIMRQKADQFFEVSLSFLAEGKAHSPEFPPAFPVISVRPAIRSTTKWLHYVPGIPGCLPLGSTDRPVTRTLLYHHIAIIITVSQCHHLSAQKRLYSPPQTSVSPAPVIKLFFR